MAKEVMRHSKAKGKANVRNISKHNQAERKTVEAIRDADLKGGPTSICIENLRFNISLVKCETDFNTKIEKVLEERMPGKKIRKDAVTLLDGIYTMSPEKIKYLEVRLHIDEKDDCPETRQAKQKWREEHQEWVTEYRELSKEERTAKVQADYAWIKEYAEKCVDFEKRHYGECISAVVHFHEDTVHVHTNSIPIMKGNDGNWKLSAKDIIGNKAKLSQMQTLFHEEVGKEMGLERGVCRTSSEIKKHLNKIQKDSQDLEKKLEEMQNQYNILFAQYNNLKDDYTSLKEEYAEIMKLYTSLDARISDLNTRIVQNVDKMETAVKKSISERSQRIREAQTKVEEFVKNCSKPELVFGSLSTLNHEVSQLEEFMEEEDWER